MAPPAPNEARPSTRGRDPHPARHPQIVFVNRFYWPDQSATSQLLTDLAEALAARGHAVAIVCSRQLYGDPATRLASEERIGGVRIHRVATTRFGRDRLVGRAIDYASFYVSCAAALFTRLGAGDVLIAMTDPPLLSILAAPIARRKRASLVNWLQDVFPEVASHLGANPLPLPLDGWLRRRRDASLRAARINVIIGRRMRELLVGRGIAPEKLVVIDNWADADIAPKPTAESALREREGLRDRFVVAYSGNLGRAHEYETLIGAAERLAADPAYAFLMIGGGAKMGPLGAEVVARGLMNFRFLPYQPRTELGDSLAAADVHLVSLIPALEGLIVPSKLYGILAAGRPTVFVGDPEGEIARIVRDADCGVAVGVGDADGLAAVLEGLRKDPARCAAMGGRARAAYEENYSREAAVGRWEAVLGDL
ncbi:MAG: glycosyltransferase family 4 protein [Gammaproteobacteria bacterium]|nr:glycosyltransferase family 4 protein [Gammaproteobacteria bacterium]